MKLLPLSLVCLVSFTQIARADTVTAHGVTLEVPAGWSKAERKGVVVLQAPTKGRQMIIAQASSVPAATEDGVEAWLTGQRLGEYTISEVKQATKDGVEYLVATGARGDADEANSFNLVAIKHRGGAVVLMAFSPLAAGDADRRVLLGARLAGAAPTAPTAPTPPPTAADPLVGAKVVFQGKNLSFAIAPARSKHLKGLGVPLAKVVVVLAKQLDTKLEWPRPVKLYLYECGVDNSYYSRTTHEVHLCYDMIHFTRRVLEKAGYPAKRAIADAEFAMIGIFLHELAHALHREFDLPITGKGEDAADEWASILLSTSDQAAKVAESTVVFWDALARLHPQNNYNDEHSLDAQRASAIACILYGSNAKKYTPLLRALKFTAKRASKCVVEYEDKKRAYERLIAPHVR